MQVDRSRFLAGRRSLIIQGRGSSFGDRLARTLVSEPSGGQNKWELGNDGNAR